MIGGMEGLGFDLTHVYGLTEVYGPAAVCMKHDSWRQLPLDERVRRNGRQGVRYPVQEGLTVLDPETMKPVPADGQTMGEVMFRGNIVMTGYLKNPMATAEAFAGGWFHSGDLVRMDDEGFVYVVDRKKDMIISGGENIYCAEVENALFAHPKILEAAVVGRADDRWGEVPVAIVVLNPGEELAFDELIEFLNDHLARFKQPKELIIIDELPRNASGKVIKPSLRQEYGGKDAGLH